MRSYLELATDFIRASSGESILQRDLLAYVANKRKSTIERVRGTVIKHNGGLLNPKLLAALGVHRERSPARWVKGKALKAPSLTSYDCPVKREVVAKILSHIKPTDSPTFVTMAGHQGLDVKQFLSQFPNGRAVSFERDKEIAATFRANFPSVQTEVKDFAKAADLQADLAFYDSVGYACSSMDTALTAFNKSKKAKTVAVTTINIKKFRNRGFWVDWAKANFKGEDPTREWIKAIMSNYKLVDEIIYTKTNVKGARAMRVFIFEVCV